MTNTIMTMIGLIAVLSLEVQTQNHDVMCLESIKLIVSLAATRLRSFYVTKSLLFLYFSRWELQRRRMCVCKCFALSSGIVGIASAAFKAISAANFSCRSIFAKLRLAPGVFRLFLLHFLLPSHPGSWSLTIFCAFLLQAFTLALYHLSLS